MSYGNGISALYLFEDVDLGAGATLRIPNPNGAEGRLISLSTVVTTVHVGAQTNITMGNSGDPNAYADASIASAAALGTRTRTFTRGVENRIAADDDVEIVVDSSATSGAAHVAALIEWYGGDAS